MAFENENQIVIASIPKNDSGDYIIVKSISHANEREIKAIDIRRYFTKDGEILPTTKGLRIAANHIQEIYDALGILLEEMNNENS